MSEHWHHCSWEINKDAPATHATHAIRRPRVPIGAVSFIEEPESPMWRSHGYGAYRAVSGRYEFAHVVWRCDDKDCRP